MPVSPSARSPVAAARAQALMQQLPAVPEPPRVTSSPRAAPRRPPQHAVLPPLTHAHRDDIVSEDDDVPSPRMHLPQDPTAPLERLSPRLAAFVDHWCHHEDTQRVKVALDGLLATTQDSETSPLSSAADDSARVFKAVAVSVARARHGASNAGRSVLERAGQSMSDPNAVTAMDISMSFLEHTPAPAALAPPMLGGPASASPPQFALGGSIEARHSDEPTSCTTTGKQLDLVPTHPPVPMMGSSRSPGSPNNTSLPFLHRSNSRASNAVLQAEQARAQRHSEELEGALAALLALHIETTRELKARVAALQREVTDAQLKALNFASQPTVSPATPAASTENLPRPPGSADAALAGQPSLSRVTSKNTISRTQSMYGVRPLLHGHRRSVAFGPGVTSPLLPTGAFDSVAGSFEVGGGDGAFATGSSTRVQSPRVGWADDGLGVNPSNNEFFTMTRGAEVGEEADDGTSTINQYVVLQELGEGSQAKVMLALDPATNEMRAIKIVKRPQQDFAVSQLDHNAAVAGMYREIAIMKKCRHRSIVTLYEVIDDPDHEALFLVMQYVEHGSLREMRDDGTCQPIDATLLANYARQLSAGLQYLHRRGVIHGDIKPENILLGSNDTVFLADFGVSQFVGNTSRDPTPGSEPATSHSESDISRDSSVNSIHSASLTGKLRPRKLIGTPVFKPPEDAVGKKPESKKDAATWAKAGDVYALGLSLYVMLFGQLPWPLQSAYQYMCAVRDEPVTALPTAVSDLPGAEAWQEVLLGMLHPDPAQRLPSDRAAKLLKDLDEALASGDFGLSMRMDTVDIASAITRRAAAPSSADLSALRFVATNDARRGSLALAVIPSQCNLAHAREAGDQQE